LSGNRKRSISDDTQPMHESAEKHLAYLNRPTYYILRQLGVDFIRDLGICLCLLHFAHIDNLGQQDARVKLTPSDISRILEQAQGVAGKLGQE